jgi:hypothetical protein
VRLIRIEGIDLNLFEFDLDLTWTAFLMNADGKVYGRFGGRDAKGADTRNSLAGLHYAMQSALAEHRKNPAAKPETMKPPLFIEKVPAARGVRGCVHCHQAKELLRQEALNTNTWQRDSIYTYPLPENVGITLDKDKGDRISEIKPASPAAKIGLKAGDIVQTINKVSIHSFADAQYGLHTSPAKGAIPITWQRDGKSLQGNLIVEQDWKRTNVTWRPSLLDLLPSLAVYGSDLTAKEKQELKLDAKRLAFRQEAPVHANAKAMGVR